jgi:hypothetical protein
MTWAAVLQLVAVAGVSFIGTWAANKVEMHYLRRDVDHAHKRLDEHDKQFTEIYRTWP